MKTIAILNDAHDADYVVQHRTQFDTITLISTHAAVDDYLEAHGLSCKSISSYLKSEEVVQFYAEADCVNAVLHELDKEFGDELNQRLGFNVPLRFFYALYRYRGRYEYTNLLKSKIAFERLLSYLTPQRVMLFQPHNDSISAFSTQINIFWEILAANTILVEKIVSPLSKQVILHEQKNKKQNKLKRLFSSGTYYILKNLIRKYLFFEFMDASPIAIKERDGYIILVNGTRSAELLPGFIKAKVSRGIRLQRLLRAEEIYQPMKLVDAQRDAVKLLGSEKEINLIGTFRAIVLDDFCCKFAEYIGPVVNLHTLSQNEKILGGVWISPPSITNNLILLVEYLLQNNLIVVGRQHGGNYGIEVSQPKHFDSDFWWSTHYLSYGFTKEDLAETSPALQASCQIIPAGEKTTVLSNPSAHERIDILFPISNAVFFYKEALRTSLHQLSEYQRELLKFLNQLSSVRVVVKPFPGYNYKTTAFMKLLPACKNLEVLDIPFTQALEKYSVGAIVSEFPSSPLFECLKTDAEILSLTNPLLPFNSTAKLLLEKRVYFYDSLPQIKQGITDFLDSRLVRRRDSGFVDKYLLPADPEAVKKITAQIFGIE